MTAVVGQDLAVDLSTVCRDLPLIERAGAAKADGYTRVESWWDFDSATPPQHELDAFAASIDAAGVRLVALNSFAGDRAQGERGLASLPGRRDEFERSIVGVVAMAERLGEIGSAVTRVKVGDRIALDSHAACGDCFQCRMGRPGNCMHMRLLANDLDGVFAERVAVPERLAFAIPDSMSFETATLLEPSGVAWHAIQRSGKDIAANVILVSGCGPIGLLIVGFALLLGASEAIAVEPNEYRRGLAAELGATTFAPGAEVLDHIGTSHAHRGGVDVAFEVSGAAVAYPTLFDAVRRNGQIVAVGHAGKPISLNISQYINKKEITLHGISGRALWQTWEELSAMIEARRLDLEWLITHRLPLGELGPVIDLLSGEANKVILHPGRTA